MKNSIEKNLPYALVAVEQKIKKGKDKIPSEYNGYISSLGAGIVQSGLLPTLAFFANENQSSAEDRKPLLEAIQFIIDGKRHKEAEDKKNREAGSNERMKISEIDIKTTSKTLLERAADLYQEDAIIELQNLKKEIREAAIAIKLALRTFPLAKK